MMVRTRKLRQVRALRWAAVRVAPRGPVAELPVVSVTYPTSLSAPCWRTPAGCRHRRATLIAILAGAGILLHLLARFGLHASVSARDIPLLATLALGGVPLLDGLLRQPLRRSVAGDVLVGVALVVAIATGAWLAGAALVVVLAACGALRRDRAEQR